MWNINLYAIIFAKEAKMRKITVLFCVFCFSMVAFAENSSKDLTSQKNKTDEIVSEKVDLVSPDNILTPQKAPQEEFIKVEKNNQVIYYDKNGKLLARSNKIDNATFFYNNVGRFIGKNVLINNKTYYYNSLGKFIGICDESGCTDKDFNSTGIIPPLPTFNKQILLP